MNLKRSVDPADECVKNVDVVMTMLEDENKKGLEEGGVRDVPQKELQICCRGHNFLQSQLIKADKA